MQRLLPFMPLAIMAVVVAFFAWGLLFGEPAKIPSQLIGKPLPAFQLQPLRPGDPGISSEDFKGKVTLLNVFASWCQPCRIEHPLLMELKQAGVVDIYGLNYKDTSEAVLPWLARDGDPYARIGVDPKGRAGLDLGVYGVPESFLVDHNGIIQFKQIGPFSPSDVKDKLLPLIEKLKLCAASKLPAC